MSPPTPTSVTSTMPVSAVTLVPKGLPTMTTSPDPRVQTVPTTSPNPTTNSTSTSEIQKCLSLLADGNDKIITNQTDIVFLLGMTGSGKTTLVQFLATNNNNLISEEIGDNIGEYIINDSGHKISNSTIVSQTIFPELYLDPEMKIAFYDNPGFSDTRGLGVDIAGAYFVRKVINEAKNIRFILTTNYSSVRRGMDRGDFLELLNHTLDLLRNIDPYLDSIALVITKVENSLMRKGGELVSVPDTNIIENVAKFLLDLKANIPKVARGARAENIAKLVDILLRKKGSSYEKIALFRRPDESGPLSQIPLMQEGKAVIKKVIRDNLKQAIVNKEDFGFAISEESKNKLYDVIIAINENIAAEIREICNSKMLSYNRKATESTDIYQFYNILQSDFENLRDWLASTSDEVSLTEFVNDLFATSQLMRVTFSEEEKNRILSQGKYNLFLETINGKKFKGSASSWKMGLQSYLHYLKESTSWYKYLKVWHTVLSNYAIQKRRTEFAPLLQHQVTSFYDDQFVKLLTLCKTQTNELDNFQSVVMDPTKMDQLYRIFETTLTSDTKSVYDESTKTLTVQGRFVKLSDVTSDKNVQKAHFVNVFAIEKLFVDVDFKRVDDKLQTLSLVAPTAEVVGDVHIKLDGEKGCCKPMYRAEGGDPYSKTGHDGSPGAPGKSAANFIGLINTVINGERLKISANGGQGAAGQDGGNGADGYDGDSPITKNRWGCAGNDFNRFTSQQLGGFVRRVYCVYGDSGGDGGDGGDGGVGGLGGHAGKVVFPLKQLSNVRIEVNEGAVGTSGSGGESGAGGRAGRSWNHQKMLWWWKDASCSNSQRLADEYGDCANSDYLRNGRKGIRGTPGANRNGIQVADPTIFLDIASFLDKYREFLRAEVNNDTISRISKSDFLIKLDVLSKFKGRNSDQHQFNVGRRLKRMAQLESNRVKRYETFDNEKPRWINADCFHAPQWPIIDKIEHEQATTDVHLTSVNSIPFTEMLLLTDLLVRKLNQTRPNYLQSCTVNYIEVRVCAMHILSVFEKILSNIYGVGDGESIFADLDAISTMEKLEKEILNGSPQNMIKILLDSLDNELPERKIEVIKNLIAELQFKSS